MSGATVESRPDAPNAFGFELATELSAERRAQLIAMAEGLRPWLQGPFPLGGDLVIPGERRADLRWGAVDAVAPDDLSGKRALDVGSNAGYNAFTFRARGAGEVVACEPLEFHAQAVFLESVYRSGVDFRNIGWWQLDPARDGTFDLVHCHGVLHHEVDPMGLLSKLRAMVADGGELLLGSVLLSEPEHSHHLRFVPDSFGGDPTWWFVPGRLALRWMLEAAGFAVEELPVAAGPSAEFPTLAGYFRCRPTDPVRG